MIRFRPRGTVPQPWPGPPKWRTDDSSPVNDFAPYEGLAEPGDDRRTLVNILAAGVIVVLMLIGGWVTVTMAAIQSEQDCGFADAGHCPPIYVPYLPTHQRNKYPFL